MEKNQVLDISWETIAKIFIAIFVFYLIYLTRDIALWFFFALAISVLLTPAINFLRKFWVPKALAVIFVYFSIFGILGILIYLTAPLFIEELRQLSRHLPEYSYTLSPFLQQIGIDTTQTFANLTQLLLAGLAQSSKGVMNAVATFFGGLASTAFILTTAIFLSLEDNAFERFLKLVFPKKYEENIVTLFGRAQNKISGWFGARILSCLFVGVASYIVFYVFGIKYAFLLALISGVLNFVPYIGPLITTVLLVVFIAVSSGAWVTILYVLLAVFLVQEIDNKLLTPLLMKKLADVPPVLVLIALLVGAKLFGFLGTIFAVPVFGIIYEFLKEFLEKRREESLELQE
ncbi:MAG: AI-2E family transporter [Candidatus Staskawiczbacteria bacterium]|nr:AI-2E family transporter [Candidatus Staskawiczbacteria bacterium]